MNNNSRTITLLEQNIIPTTKTRLYLVLRQKGFQDQIIENVKEEVEKRLSKRMNDLIPKLENIQFDDPVESLKYIILKEVINILDELSKEKMIKLNEKDKEIIFNLMNKGDEKENETKFPKNEFKKGP